MQRFILFFFFLCWVPVRAQPGATLPQPEAPRAETGLSVSAAVRTGLANNPDLLLALQELGLSDAAVTQASIISNPTLSGSVRFPDRGGFDTYWEASLTQNILDFLFRGARVDLAHAQLEAARLRVHRVLFEQSAAIKTAYFRVEGDEQEVALLASMHQAADAALEMATRQRKAGTLSELDLVRQQAMQMEVQSQLLETQGRLAVDRQALLRLLGSPTLNPALQGYLPPLPSHEPPLLDLQRLAVEHRQEIGAARLDAQAARQGEDLSSRFLGIDELRVGVATSHEVEGVQITGPTLQIPLPLFNQNQGARERYRAQGKMARLSEQSALLNANYEVAQAYQRMVTARGLVENAQDHVVPLRHQAVELAKQQFNNMFLGIYALLTIYREELDSRKHLVEVQRDYWSARAELEKAVGIDLPSEENHRE